MSSIHKVTMYIVDIDDSFDKDGLEYFLERMDYMINISEAKSADIGEWHDEHPLNYYDCPIETHESYFKK